MKLKIIDKEFVICKVKDFSQINLEDEFLFIGKTDEERSIVCEAKSLPNNCTDIDEGWIAFRIEGQVDFFIVEKDSINMNIAFYGDRYLQEKKNTCMFLYGISLQLS